MVVNFLTLLIAPRGNITNRAVYLKGHFLDFSCFYFNIVLGEPGTVTIIPSPCSAILLEPDRFSRMKDTQKTKVLSEGGIIYPVSHCKCNTNAKFYSSFVDGDNSTL